MRTLLSTCVVLAAATGASAQVGVPVHEEPRHRLVLERPLFRILDVRLPAGDTTLFHVHDAPIHYVMISASPIHAQTLGRPWPPAPAGDALAPIGGGWWTLEYAREPLTHRVANIGSTLFHLIAVIHRGPGRPTVPPAAAAASGALPGTLEADSEWFRRSRLTLQPGEEVRAAQLESPIVLIQVTDGRLELRTEAGAIGTSGSAGDWLVMERASPYRLRNTGPVAATFVLVGIRS